MILSQTKLSVALKGTYLEKLEPLGQVMSLAPGETLYEANSPSGDMHVIVEGDINLYKEGQNLPVVWLGPGDVLGEIGFVLRRPRTTAARAGSRGCRLWRLDRRVLSQDLDPETMDLMTRLFIGMAPYLRVRYAKIIGEKVPELRALPCHCDHEHPTVQHMAEFLVGMDTWETAGNIWEYVRHLPTRFGFWNLPASQVLSIGYGTCTTKANLQVALLRACDIEAAFGEIEIPSAILTPIIPPGYHHIVTMQPTSRHVFATIRVGGEWFPCDASYSPTVWSLLAPSKAEASFEPGRPFNPLAELTGHQERDYRQSDDLRHILKERPFYDADNVEAMNIILDKVQGPFLMIPEWVLPIHYLMETAPRAAYQRAYAGIVTEVERLHRAICGGTS